MKKRIFSVICFLSLIFLTAIVHGQGFNRPGLDNNRPGRPVMAGDRITVSEAKNLPKDSWVVISGNIVNTLPGGKYYTFRDSSGEITVEIEPKVWRGLSVEPSDRVVIGGEIEVSRGQVSIEVKTISGSGRMNARRGQAVTITQPVSVNEVKNLPHDSWVIITGNIVSSLPPPNDYMFRDSSGEIIIDIGPKEWRGLSVSETDRVEISGEVKIGKAQVPIKIKVHAIRKI